MQFPVHREPCVCGSFLYFPVQENEYVDLHMNSWREE